MVSFAIALVLLVVGYLFYGKIIERIFGIEPERKTPALTMTDGVDYLPMKPWKIFLIQFLNIAGLGPIFGAIMGARFGTSSFLWIVFGSIFAGAVHDFMSGMISMRMNGASLPEIHGKYLGNGVKLIMRVFTILLMVLVGVVFVVGPADILAGLTPKSLNATFWIVVILVYYVCATLLPIDKIIGAVYPFFGFCLLFMAVSIMGYLFVKHPVMPEIWDGLQNRQPNAAVNPIFPMMFISIACGAISGFHATQSPLMARCITNEKQGRPIFYGAMITEGIVALIWAAAASVFFNDPQYSQQVSEFGTKAPAIVDFITRTWLGRFGAVLALLGVVFAPITSGDTAFRSVRLMCADMFHYDQKPIYKRLVIAVPLFVCAFFILLWDINNPNGFGIIWNFFAWANQTLAVFTLWAITIYLLENRKCFWITLIPALFMTMVCSTFIFIAPDQGFGLSKAVSYSIGGCVTLTTLILFIIKARKQTQTNLLQS